MKEDASSFGEAFGSPNCRRISARETGEGLVERTSRRSKAVGEESVGRRGLRSASVRRAAAREGGEKSNGLLGKSVEKGRVCSLSPVTRKIGC